MKCKVVKTLSGWSPANEDTEKYHKKFSLGDLYHFDVKHYKDQRNQKLLEKYWVLLGVVVDNHPNYRTKEDLHTDIKWALDIVEVRKDIRTGEMYKVAGSVAMNKMTQEEFESFYSDSINVILKFILQGATEEELNERVMAILPFG